MGKHEPQSWGDETSPYINSRGVVMDRERCKPYVALTGGAYGSEHLGFTGYMAVADAICVARFGLGVHDFADQTWRDWYDDRVTPFDAVQMMAENEGLDVFEQEED